MDSTAILLGLFIIVLLVVVIYLLFNPTYEIIPGRRHHYRPQRVMPQFGPYWAHGGQSNSGLLY
jgi:hypothetical protein